MREPWTWLGWIVVAGACSWPAWTPAPLSLLLGAAHLSLLAWAGHTARASLLALAAAAFLLGAAAPGLLPPPADDDHLRGKIVAASTHRAVLQTSAGQAELWFADSAPRPGTAIAAWTEPARRHARLPGTLDPQPALQRAHRTRRKVRRWVTISTPQPTRQGKGKEWFQQAEHGGLLWALASGDRAEVPEETIDLMRRTGTAHLLAISGMHIGLVAGAAWSMAWMLSRPLTSMASPWPARTLPTVAAIAAAASYAAMVGWPVSARRAAAMVAAVAVARLMGRKARLWNLLGLVAATITLTDPAQVGEIGFWMSFGAVAGILWWAHALTRWLPPDHPWWAGWLLRSLGASMGATIGTLPVTAWMFQQLSPLTLLTNLIAGPMMAGIAVPAAIAARILTGDGAAAALCIADATAAAAMAVLGAMDVPPLTPAVGPAGAVLLALILPLRRKPVAAAGLALIALTLRPQPDRLHVSFLSVGQGDAALVEWPDGHRWLIDGGPPSERLLHYLRRRGIRHIDAVLLSHPHADHMGGLVPVIENLSVGQLWVPRPPGDGEDSFQVLWDAAEDHQVALRMPEHAGQLERATLLHPLGGWRAADQRRRINEESLVIRIDHGSHSFLFTGDIEHEAESEIAQRVGTVDVVKVAHHGSASSSAQDFVDAAQAQWAIISCGSGNRFRHPRPLTLHRWRDATVLRTDLHGSIRFETDGDNMVVRRGDRTIRTDPR